MLNRTVYDPPFTSIISLEISTVLESGVFASSNGGGLPHAERAPRGETEHYNPNNKSRLDFVSSSILFFAWKYTRQQHAICARPACVAATALNNSMLLPGVRY